MDTTQPIDIRFIVSRLAPGAEFHWKGLDFGTYADIGEWRSPDIPKPAESEVYAEWDRYQAQTLAQQRVLNALNTSITGLNVYQMDITALRACVALLMLKANAITLEGVIKPIDEWL